MGRHGVEGELLVLRLEHELFEDAELCHLLHLGGTARIDPTLFFVGVPVAVEAGTGVALLFGEHDIGVRQVGIVAIRRHLLMNVSQNGDGASQSQCEAGNVDSRMRLETSHCS